MINHKIIFQYAKSLISLSHSREELENHLSQIDELIHLLKENPILAQLLDHPFATGEKKKEILKKLLNNSGNESILHFLFLLIDKKRISYLSEIAEEYRRLAKKELEIVEASVTTAIPIEEKTQEEILRKLESMYRKKVQLELHVDPEILGGLVLRISNQILNHSTKNQLMSLKQSLLNGAS